MIAALNIIQKSTVIWMFSCQYLPHENPESIDISSFVESDGVVL